MEKTCIDAKTGMYFTIARFDDISLKVSKDFSKVWVENNIYILL